MMCFVFKHRLDLVMWFPKVVSIGYAIGQEADIQQPVFPPYLPPIRSDNLSFTVLHPSNLIL